MEFQTGIGWIPHNYNPIHSAGVQGDCPALQGEMATAPVLCDDVCDEFLVD